MKLKYTPLILLFLLSPFINSCVSNADFNQVNLDVEPILNFPLVYFELDQSDFLDDTGTIEIQAVADVTELEFFNSTTVRENLTRVDLLFELTNQFDRAFRIEVDFLDIDDNITYSFADIPIGVFTSDLQVRQNILIADNPQVLNTAKVRVTVNILSTGVVLDPTIERRFKFESVGIFYLDL
ncbi:hypothetical protein AAON49_10250 [Pseudotenacibaculum sp. MALMAid0570]|uniref:hypothetical protein n=1 Tax=Pseudotenacibaculum sp. MALMAid0570 TaxID=3143938 RepID=UPI0032DF6718